MRIAKPFLVAGLLAATTSLLGACTTPPVPQARVVVTVVPSAHPQDYDVHVAQARVDFRSRFTLRSGQTRTLEVPKGWVTVRVAGVCVVPTTTAGTTTVEVRPDDCRIV